MRVELSLHDHATARQHRELGAFARYCIARIERDAEVANWWRVKVVPATAGFHCDVIMEYWGVVMASAGDGLDGALSVWEALCKMEHLLHDKVAAQTETVRVGSRET